MLLGSCSVVLLDATQRIAAEQQAQWFGKVGDMDDAGGGCLCRIARLPAVIIALIARHLSDSVVVARPTFPKVVDEPAKSVLKPPGSMIVTLMPSGPTSLARTSEKPSTPHFAAA